VGVLFSRGVRNSKEGRGSVVQNDAQERAVNFETVGIVNETQFFEFVHEQIHAGARRADHFRQRLLRYLGKDSLRLVFLAIAGQ
jgi:hypothetical protein